MSDDLGSLPIRTETGYAISAEITNFPPGLTLRQYLAGQAATGMSSFFPEFGNSHAKVIAKHAVEIADALIEELQPKPPKTDLETKHAYIKSIFE